MPVLHFGVTDIPYSNPPSKRQRKAKSGTQTTGDVATFLENKYHVMEVFYHERQNKIADSMASSVKNAVESLMLGAPASIDPFGEGTSDIENEFRNFINSKAMDRLGYPGVPTKASLKGVSHRFKNKQGVPGRPSFQDTGLYESSFKAWVS